MKYKNWAAIIDVLTLCALIVAMCSQINLGDIGRDTSAEGYVTKQLKIALPDIALFLCFGWFMVHTTVLRAWKKIWWPPFPCWALILALVISALHARPLLNALIENLAEAHGIKQMLVALKNTKESKEAIAETIQFAGYFVIAPLLFVNLIHDRRDGVLQSRRRLALWTFFITLAVVIFYALLQLVQSKANLEMADAPRALFSSPNAYAGFCALALPILLARLLNYKTSQSWAIGLSVLAVLVFAATLVSPWAVVVLLCSLIITGILVRASNRTVIAVALAGILLFFTWPNQGPLAPLRHDLMHVGSSTEKVRKQYVEWFVGVARLSDGREASFATGAGPGNYQFNIGSYYGGLPNEKKMPPDSNSLFLVQAVNLGILGLSAILWILLYFSRVAFEALKKYSDDWLAAGVLGSIIAWTFVNFFHALIVRGTGVVLAFILSLAIIALHRDQEPVSETPSLLDDFECARLSDDNESGTVEAANESQPLVFCGVRSRQNLPNKIQ